MMSLNELDDLVKHVGTRNFAKCIARGATPYRVHDDGLSVDSYDGLGGAWGPMGTFATKAAREKWERSRTTRDSHVPYNGLARLGGKPFSARVVRLAGPAEGTGIIVVKEAPGWHHVATITAEESAAAIRELADDDATIIDTDGKSLRRMLMKTATLCGIARKMPQMNADKGTQS